MLSTLFDDGNIIMFDNDNILSSSQSNWILNHIDEDDQSFGVERHDDNNEDYIDDDDDERHGAAGGWKECSNGNIGTNCTKMCWKIG